MFVHSRIVALVLFGFVLLSAAPEARAALQWTSVTPGSNSIVVGSLLIGGHINWTGTTPAVTAVKDTLIQHTPPQTLLSD